MNPGSRLWLVTWETGAGRLIGGAVVEAASLGTALFTCDEKRIVITGDVRGDPVEPGRVPDGWRDRPLSPEEVMTIQRGNQ